MPRHQFGRLAGERVGFVWVGRRICLVEEFSDPVEQDLVVTGRRGRVLIGSGWVVGCEGV
jgi:hypothetical protein